MICALVAATLMSTPATVSVGDYFPLIPGTKWEYQEFGSFGGGSTDEVRAAEDVGGQPAHPVVTLVRGKEDSRRYYRIDGDTLLLVAYDAKKPLSSPTPVLKVGPGKVKWEYTGETTFIHDSAPLTMKCESTYKGKKSFQGTDVEMIEVRLNGSIGGNSGTAVKSNQVAYYAKGIGLVEMQSENRVGSSKSKSQLKLVRFEIGKPG